MSFFSEFFKRLNEGQPFFMYPNLLVLLTIVGLLIWAFLRSENKSKTITLIKHLSLFALVWGFLGQMIGLIGAFDAIQAVGPVSTQMLAGGLKFSALSPTFGMVIFVIARLGLITLTLLEKKP